MDDDSDMATVYVHLPEEAVDAWRPVEAIEEGDTIYRLDSSAAPEGEAWEFPPGARVRCEVRELSDGPALVAVELVG
jgi:hypothetical protein